MSWQLEFLPVFILVGWMLYVLKNLSSFRKDFQKIERKDRSTEMGALLIKDLKKKVVIHSIIAALIGVVIYLSVYFMY